MYDIEKLLEKYSGTPDKKNAAMEAARYSLLGGGKRLRPLFVLRCAEMTGAVDENTERMAAAIEMIHTYSLIHDDLPAMDDDDLRRGKPSCHKQFGEGTAILAGDALQSLAYETLSGAPVCTPEYMKAVNFIAKMSGASGMVFGQSLDISGANKTERQYFEMAKRKTANMFVASVAAPAIYLGVGEAELGLLKKFGENYGVLFQLADDAADGDGWAGENPVRAAALEEESYRAAKECLAKLPFDTSCFKEILEKTRHKIL